MTPQRRADREHQRQAREQAERRSEEAVRMAQEHYFLGGRSGERDGEGCRRSLTYVCSFPAVCFATV